MKLKLTKKEILSLEEKSYSDLRIITNLGELKKLSKKYLEKKGVISNFLKYLASLNNNDEKKSLGNLLNSWKKQLIKKSQQLEKRIKNINPKSNKQLFSEETNISLEGKKINIGFVHPISQVIQKICDIFIDHGYKVVESQEIENTKYNFNKLNMPLDHPARTMRDSFYFSNQLLLRTHTSNTEARFLQKYPNRELKIICPGKVYRRDENDATHSHQFTQVEGMMVGKNISLSHLKWTLELFLHSFFGKKHPLRFRPSYFPFTEPSLEVDAQCFCCHGKGCGICKRSGWVEILGAGLLHPQVLENCGFDSKKFTGFAFGLGVERLLMTHFNIEDIRNFYLNDVRFLKQFKKI